MSRWAVASPSLIVVSGSAGSGKTTLAHAIASAIGCPAICRDEIKEGMAHTSPGFTPSTGDPLSQRTLTTFFDVLHLLLSRGVTVVAEAAFQDRRWRPGLEALADLATIRIIRCTVDADVARARIARRVQQDTRRAVHDDQGLLRALATGTDSLDAFVPISLPAPTIHVDTTSGYDPKISDIVAFINRSPNG